MADYDEILDKMTLNGHDLVLDENWNCPTCPVLLCSRHGGTGTHDLYFLVL